MVKLPSFRRLSRKLKIAGAHHKSRRRPTGYKFAIFDSIEFVNEQVWDGLVKNQSIFFQREYLDALERTKPTNLQPRYALIYLKAQPVAVVVMQLVDFSFDQVVGTRVKKSDLKELFSLFGQVANSVGQKLRGRLLVCGNLFTWGPYGVCCATDVSLAETWPAVAELLYRVRRGERLSGDSDFVLIKDLSSPQNSGASKLRRISYHPCETDPNMVLKIPKSWRSYDDYLSSLEKKYRKAARQIMQETNTLNLTIELVEDIGSVSKRLYELYCEVQRNNSLCIVSITPEYLVELKKTFKEKFRCTVIKQGEEIVGFITSIQDRTTLVGYYIGFDRKAAESAPIYLRLLHTLIEDALALGCGTISLGRTALEPKARLGAKPEKLFIWTRHRAGILNLFLRALVNVVPHSEAPERNPFKED